MACHEVAGDNHPYYVPKLRAALNVSGKVTGIIYAMAAKKGPKMAVSPSLTRALSPSKTRAAILSVGIEHSDNLQAYAFTIITLRQVCSPGALVKLGGYLIS